ncbi:MAG TPA: hypothetical protein VF657_08590 [Actinoplanes sp.]|jgi:hypothetical protein
MGLIRPSVLLFAVVMSAPALYRYVTGELDIGSVLMRYLIAVPIAAVLLAGLRFVTAGYGATDEPSVPVTPEPDHTPADQQP